MRGIGEMARASGLSVSALRFYDGAGVLVPAEVDPVTGYRRYADGQVRAARLVASLRRVGMPLADIVRAVHGLSDPASVRRLLDEHLRRLEHGLADARRELSSAHALLDLEDRMTRVTLPAAALAATLDAVRFAAGTDPALPMLGGVLFETSADGLTLVATDRYRLAVARADATVSGPPARVVVPLGLVDEVRPRLAGDEPVTLTLGPDSVELGPVAGPPLGVDFPDHRRLIGAPVGPRVTVEVAALRAALAAQPVSWREHDGTAYPVAVLGVDPAGRVRLAAEAEWAGDADAHVAVNREFLLQALDAGGAGQLVLELDGPIRPLAVRVPDADRFSLLMPVRH
ncbi:DNA polymerase III subunit beta family protein [Jidongwangia harbinensis]|uniref:DNA polymerase III subunit beta family protein n=1 Tax=Jidongwangia harbinensis TaxID=2878561 RepID=UPI001CD9D163|nr:MerR family transcriptional regulator [Jidongwangia harbinensis]MCA2213330.1 MerR family DNA-binding transcriptional regulator [Jidongwangia harbinensis]